jgi:hypothetical protein
MSEEQQDILKINRGLSNSLSHQEDKSIDDFINHVKNAALCISKNNREMSIVKTKLEEATMWFNKGMYRGD